MLVFRALSLFTTTVAVINFLGRFLDDEKPTSVKKPAKRNHKKIAK